MTDVVTQACPSCGTDVYGTKFCESCGAEVTPAPTVAPISMSASAAYPPAPYATGPVVRARRGGTALRVVALLLILIGNFLPTFFLLGNPLNFELGLNSGAYVAVEVTGGMLLALALLIAAATGSAGAGGKALGITFALANAVITLVEAFDPQAMAWQNSFIVMNAFAALALFLSWGAGRPFRGPGYIALLVFAVFEVLNYYSDYGIESTVFGVGGAVLVGLVASAFLLAFIGLAILFEHRRAAPAYT